MAHRVPGGSASKCCWDRIWVQALPPLAAATPHEAAVPIAEGVRMVGGKIGVLVLFVVLGETVDFFAELAPTSYHSGIGCTCQMPGPRLL
jgi:hypothetical protein